MRKGLRIIALGFLVFGLLFVLKPTSNDFESWLKKSAARKRGKAQGENVVERLVEKGVVTATQLQILATYRHHDHLVWTTVEATANGEKLKFIGVAKIWIPLQIK